MSGRLVLLGTGTCVLDSGRSASAVLVEVPPTRLVFDFGRGVAVRVAELGIRQDQLEHVILSHYHPDHFSDLIPYLHAALHAPGDRRTRDLHVYGPAGLDAVMSGVTALAGLTDLEAAPPFQVHLHPLQPQLTIDTLTLRSGSLPPAGNHGIRIRHEGCSVALTGDSHFHSELVEFLRDVEVAVIDAGHLTDPEIVELAVASQAGRILCSHLYRELDIEILQARARGRGFEGRLSVGHDLMEISL